MEVKSHLTRRLSEPCVDWGMPWGTAPLPALATHNSLSRAGAEEKEKCTTDWGAKRHNCHFPQPSPTWKPWKCVGGTWESEGRVGAPAPSATVSWETRNCDYLLDTVLKPKLVGLGHVTYVYSMGIVCLADGSYIFFWVQVQACFMQGLHLLLDTGFCKMLDDFQLFIFFFKWWQILLRDRDLLHKTLAILGVLS